MLASRLLLNEIFSLYSAVWFAIDPFPPFASYLTVNSDFASVTSNAYATVAVPCAGTFTTQFATKAESAPPAV